MEQLKLTGERRTSVDEIFEYLHEEIVTLNLRPGDKISEAEIAAKFGVSRQPVRDAFSRLSNLDLLLIRPQRATEVKRFSAKAIRKSRFVRAAVEAEVLRRAAALCTDEDARLLDQALAEQRNAMEAGDFETFGSLDYAFHHRLCQIAQTEFAFDIISTEKAKVDRLCMLGLSKENRMPQLLRDHQAIADAVKDGDSERAVEAAMHHLSRLDSTIAEISATNASYFDQEAD